MTITVRTIIPDQLPVPRPSEWVTPRHACAAEQCSVCQCISGSQTFEHKCSNPGCRSQQKAHKATRHQPCPFANHSFVHSWSKQTDSLLQASGPIKRKCCHRTLDHYPPPLRAHLNSCVDCASSVQSLASTQRAQSSFVMRPISLTVCAAEPRFTYALAPGCPAAGGC